MSRAALTLTMTTNQPMNQPEVSLQMLAILAMKGLSPLSSPPARTTILSRTRITWANQYNEKWSFQVAI